MTDRTLYWMWLQAAIGQGTATAVRMFRHFSSIEAIYAADREDYRYVGVPDNTLDRLCDKSLDTVSRLAERALANGGWILTPDDTDYPSPFKQLYSQPLAIYGKGVLPNFERMPVIGMVGTRSCTAYGLQAAGAIAAGLAAAGCPVISGGAKGIDRAAHEGALYGGGVTIAVQGCGLDVEYPAVNRQMREQILACGGALISEYPPGSTVTRSVFQVRNRLISGLSWGVCVVEAPQRSGAMMTARLARDQGKDVFAVPGMITSPASVGCHQLLRDSACLVTSAAQILQEYQIRCGNTLDEEEADRAQAAFFERSQIPSPVVPPEKPVSTPVSVSVSVQLPAQVSESCKKVYDALSDTPVSAEWLFEQTRLPLGEIFSVLTELEIYGCVHSHPGQQYSR